jgi:Leucine-rich repeat (LRR) protein
MMKLLYLIIALKLLFSFTNGQFMESDYVCEPTIDNEINCSFKLQVSGDEFEDRMNVTKELNYGNSNETIKYINVTEMTVKDVNFEFFPVKIFENFKALTNLTILSSINEIAKDNFKFAINLEVLNLSTNEIRKLQAEIFVYLKNLQELILSHNKIEIVDDRAFNGMSATLKSIDLSYNMIKTFREDFILVMLQNQSSLFIDLGENKIVNFETSINKISSSTEVTLKLSANNIKNFTAPTNQIYSIDINANNIKVIKNLNSHIVTADNNQIEFVHITRDMKMLTIDHNLISRITFDDDLSNLEELDLSDNQLTFDALYPMLRKAINLKILDLANNQIGDIRYANTFAGMKQLKHFSLSGNQINEIPFDLLENLSNLETLILSNNNLKEVNFLDILSFPRLEVLDIKDNKIKIIDDYHILKRPLPKLTRIDLANNLWECDYLLKMLTSFKAQNIEVVSSKEIIQYRANVNNIKCVAEHIESLEDNTGINDNKINEIIDKMNYLNDKIKYLSASSHKDSHNQYITFPQLLIINSVIIALTFLIIAIVIQLKKCTLSRYFCGKIYLRQNTRPSLLTEETDVDMFES